MPTFHCAAILFDLDGVLVDSTGSVSRQWTIWATGHGIDPPKVVKFAHGVRSVEVIRHFAPTLDAEAETRKLEAREADDIDGVAVMPGAAALLRSLPRNRWCVVTSGTRHLAVARLKLAELPEPKALVSADEVTNGKPHSEPYIKGAQMVDFEPSTCLVIEDAPAGIRSAHAAGMKAIAMTSTYGAEDLREADVVVSSLSEILVRFDGAGLEVQVVNS